jgi:phage-related protein (TIGR01555 family)
MSDIDPQTFGRKIQRRQLSDSITTQQHNDGWQNVLSGLGYQGRDRKESTTFAEEIRLHENVCRNLYAFSGLAQSIANLVPHDGLRRWYTVEGDTDNITLNECKRLAIQQEFARAWRWSRVYGGSVIYMQANDGKLVDEPLDENNIREIEAIRVYHRWRTARQTYYLEPDDPKYSQTEKYLITPITPFARPFTCHESRLLIFDGIDVPDSIRNMNQWWGDSIYQAIYQRLRGLGEAYGNVEHIIGEFLLMITKIKALSQKLAENNGKQIIDRVMTTNLTRHLMGSYVIDADGEDAERISATVSGLDKLMETLMMGLSADVRIPIRRLFGSPIAASGLGKDGDEETNDYYDWVIAERDRVIQSPMERLVKLLMLQKQGPFSGKELSNWSLKWNPIREETQGEKLDNQKKQSEIDRQHFDMGVLDPDEIRDSRFGGDSYSFHTTLHAKRTPASQDQDPGKLTRSDGGEGSGNFGHEGRPGAVGGSGEGGGEIAHAGMPTMEAIDIHKMGFGIMGQNQTVMVEHLKKSMPIGTKFNRGSQTIIIKSPTEVEINGVLKPLNESQMKTMHVLWALSQSVKTDSGDGIDISGTDLSSRGGLRALNLPSDEFNGFIEASGCGLTSCEGLPALVNGRLVLNRNKMKNLIGSPRKTEDMHVCSSDLESLEGAPDEVTDFHVHGNKLVDLQGCPQIINKDLHAYGNKLITMAGCAPRIMGDLLVNDNDITTLEGLPKFVGRNLSLKGNPVARTVTETQIREKCTVMGKVEL